MSASAPIFHQGADRTFRPLAAELAELRAGLRLQRKGVDLLEATRAAEQRPAITLHHANFTHSETLFAHHVALMRASRRTRARLNLVFDRLTGLFICHPDLHSLRLCPAALLLHFIESGASRHTVVPLGTGQPSVKPSEIPFARIARRFGSELRPGMRFDLALRPSRRQTLSAHQRLAHEKLRTRLSGTEQALIDSSLGSARDAVFLRRLDAFVLVGAEKRYAPEATVLALTSAGATS